MTRYQRFYARLSSATGEDVDTLACRGFQPRELALDDLDEPDLRAPLMIDWDRHQSASRHRLLPLAS